MHARVARARQARLVGTDAVLPPALRMVVAGAEGARVIGLAVAHPQPDLGADCHPVALALERTSEQFFTLARGVDVPCVERGNSFVECSGNDALDPLGVDQFPERRSAKDQLGYLQTRVAEPRVERQPTPWSAAAFCSVSTARAKAGRAVIRAR